MNFSNLVGDALGGTAGAAAEPQDVIISVGDEQDVAEEDAADSKPSELDELGMVKTFDEINELVQLESG